MNTTEYSAWLERAFLFAQAALAQELGDRFRQTMSEERLRIALLRGLVAANPTHAHRVKKEVRVPWNGATCVSHKSRIRGKGRALAHDVCLEKESEEISGGGAYIEIKWLKKDEGAAVAQDILKLALTRGVGRHKHATRTYLLLGGTQKGFASTLSSLNSIGIPLRWSPAGRGDSWPAPTRIPVGGKLAQLIGPLRRLLARAGHIRTPPAARWELQATLRERWWGRLVHAQEQGWRLALWELHAWGQSTDEFDWQRTLATFAVRCK